MRRLLVLLFAMASCAAVAQPYRWTDPATGRTMISDLPPPGNIRGVTKSRAPEEAVDSLPYATKRAVENFPVRLYTSTDCVAECKQARDLLNARGVPFTEVMVQSPEQVAELKALVGDLFVPTLKVGKQPVRGFQADSYTNILDLAGYPASAPYGSKPSGGLAK